MKKTISVLLAFLMLQSTSQAAIYEEDTLHQITEGITHRAVDTFYDTGWVKADIIKVDLTNPDLKLKVLTSPNGVSSLATVKTMAEANSTSVAVNADFFNMKSGETSMLGMLYKDGQLISTPSKDNFVSFAIDDDNNVLFDYFTFSGTLYAENTSLTDNASCELYQINKEPVTTGGITMITSAWGSEVTIPQLTYAMACERYSDDQYKMTGLSWGGEKLAIPQDGAVFIANYNINSFLNLNFAAGDIIRVETTISPDPDSIREASGGNTLLIKDGEIVPFTSDITGKAQRTAMGLSPSGETLLLVTIDGREDDCPGFTQTQLAEFMLALGCSDAINLDGGGSTTLVYPDLFTGEQTVKNSVTTPRRVSTAIGVISSHETGDAEGGSIKLSDDTIVLGDSVNVSYVFTDRSNNRLSIPSEDIRISCSDPYAIIENDRVMPTSDGIHTIYAEYNGIALEAELLVISDIFAINIYPEKADVTKSEKAFTVTAYDRSGNAALIPSNLISFEASGDITVSENKVLAGEGAGTITAIYEDLTSTAVINDEIYRREDDIKAPDLFEGFFEDGETITVTGAISKPKNIIGRYLSEERLNDLSIRPDVYALSDDIYDPKSIFTVYKKVNGFTQRIIDSTRIITVANDKLSIRKSEENSWGNLKIVFETMEEDNLVILTNEPIYSLNNGERRVWNHFMSALNDKGVNVFVVSTGTKSEAVVENGVRYLYVGDMDYYSSHGYDYSLKSTLPLTLSFSNGEVNYLYQ